MIFRILVFDIVLKLSKSVNKNTLLFGISLIWLETGLRGILAELFKTNLNKHEEIVFSEVLQVQVCLFWV